MKRILLLILGYYLVIQAALGILSACGKPEHAVLILIISGLSGWGGYSLIQRARAGSSKQPHYPDDLGG